MVNELDTEIAEKVFGGPHQNVQWYWWKSSTPSLPIDPPLYAGPAFSTDIAAAWTIIDRLRAQGWVMTLSVNHYVGEPWDCRFFLEQDGLLRKRVIAHGPTAEQAICQAALKAAGQDI